MSGAEKIAERIEHYEIIKKRRALWDDEKIRLETLNWCMEQIVPDESEMTPGDKTMELFRTYRNKVKKGKAGVKVAAMAVLAMLLVPFIAQAEVRSVKVCDNKTLSASTTTDCKYTDISKFKHFSVQVYCGEVTGNDMDIDVDWVGGSACGSAYMAVPVASSGTAISQIHTNYTTEDAWSTLEGIAPPVSPCGTIRFTENNGDADILCTAILNMGD